jgi:prevent-host-death family protein
MKRTIGAGEFKAKCLKLIDEVSESGDTLVITKRGKPIAELRPTAKTKPGSIIGFMKGKIRIKGDIISPLDDVEWEAMRER